MKALSKALLPCVAIAIALCGCKKPQEPTKSNRPLAEFIKDIPPGGITQPGVAYASIDLSCGGKTYTIKTGTDGGRCDVTTYDNPKQNVAICSDGGNGGGANCTDGCVSSEGKGSCSVKTTR